MILFPLMIAWMWFEIFKTLRGLALVPARTGRQC